MISFIEGKILFTNTELADFCYLKAGSTLICLLQIFLLPHLRDQENTKTSHKTEQLWNISLADQNVSKSSSSRRFQKNPEHLKPCRPPKPQLILEFIKCCLHGKVAKLKPVLSKTNSMIRLTFVNKHLNVFEILWTKGIKVTFGRCVLCYSYHKSNTAVQNKRTSHQQSNTVVLVWWLGSNYLSHTRLDWFE